MSKFEAGKLKTTTEILTDLKDETVDGSLKITDTPDYVKVYGGKNAFAHAVGTEADNACAGTMGYCILSVESSNKFYLSGDISDLKKSVNTNTVYSLRLKDFYTDIVRIASVQQIDELCGVVTVAAASSTAGLGLYKTYSTPDLVAEFGKEDGNNAFYCPSTPSTGNVIIPSMTGGHVEGMCAKAIGRQSHAEGHGTVAEGAFSHTEGDVTAATGKYSHASGHGTLASGDYSHTEGYESQASGRSSHAEGRRTLASEGFAHAEGQNTTASGQTAHSENYYTTASGRNSHAEGEQSVASGNDSHVEGCYTKASGNTSHAEGDTSESSGETSHAEGLSTKSIGAYSHSEGNGSIAQGHTSHAEGGIQDVELGTMRPNIAIGDSCHVEGGGENYAGSRCYQVLGVYGISSVGKAELSNWSPVSVDIPNTIMLDSVEGLSGIVSKKPYYSVRLGGNYDFIGRILSVDTVSNLISCDNTPASWIGRSDPPRFNNNRYDQLWIPDYPELGTYTLGYGAHAEGYDTKALQNGAHSEGTGTVAAGKYSHAEGQQTMAGYGAHAEGNRCQARGKYSHAGGSLAITGAPMGDGRLLNHDYAYAWSFSSQTQYYSHGDGTFNINPKNGYRGLYIGDSRAVDEMVLQPHNDDTVFICNTSTDVAMCMSELSTRTEDEIKNLKVVDYSSNRVYVHDTGVTFKQEKVWKTMKVPLTDDMFVYTWYPLNGDDPLTEEQLRKIGYEDPETGVVLQMTIYRWRLPSDILSSEVGRLSNNPITKKLFIIKDNGVTEIKVGAPLLGKNFDLTSNQGTLNALAEIVEALGGTVTLPTIGN